MYQKTDGRRDQNKIEDGSRRDNHKKTLDKMIKENNSRPQKNEIPEGYRIKLRMAKEDNRLQMVIREEDSRKKEAALGDGYTKSGWQKKPADYKKVVEDNDSIRIDQDT